MRLPIVEFPSIIVNNLRHFAPVFTTGEQVKHFCEYVTGLCALRPSYPLVTHNTADPAPSDAELSVGRHQSARRGRLFAVSCACSFQCPGSIAKETGLHQ